MKLVGSLWSISLQIVQVFEENVSLCPSRMSRDASLVLNSFIVTNCSVKSGRKLLLYIWESAFLGFFVGKVVSFHWAKCEALLCSNSKYFAFIQVTWSNTRAWVQQSRDALNSFPPSLWLPAFSQSPELFFEWDWQSNPISNGKTECMDPLQSRGGSGLRILTTITFITPNTFCCTRSRWRKNYHYLYHQFYHYYLY